MSNNEKNSESSNQENPCKNIINSENNSTLKENNENSKSSDLHKSNTLSKLSNFKENSEETQIQIKDKNPKNEKQEQVSLKYTPLNQDAKPFNYKKIKKRNTPNIEEINNINNDNEGVNNIQANNSEKVSEIKRNNFVKKNSYSIQSPLFSYFNDSQKYLSEQYGQNMMKNLEIK